MNSIFKPTLVLMSGRMVSFAATFFIPVVLVRIFSTAEFGAYKQIFLVYATVYAIAQLGMSESLFYFLPRDLAKAGRFIGNSLAVLLVVGIVCWGLLVNGSPAIAAVVGNAELVQYLPLIGLSLLLMVAMTPLEIVMISHKEYRLAALSYAISDIMRAISLVVPAVLFRDLHSVLLGAIAFGLLRFGGGLAYFLLRFRREFRPDLRLLSQQLTYALPFALGVVVEILQVNFHQFTVSHYFTASTFAIYSVGCLQIPLVDFIASPSANVMMVHMSEQLRDGHNSAVLAIWHETTRKLALIFFPLYGLILIASHNIITFLFTERYAASIPIFIVWSTTILLATLQTESVLRVYAKTRFLFALKLLCLLIVASLIYFSLSVFGLLGAVFVTIFAICIAKTLSLLRMKKLLGIRASQLLPWKSLAAVGGVAIIAALMSHLLQTMLILSPFVEMLVTGAVFAVSYVILLFRFDVLRDTEKAALTGWFQKLRPNVDPVNEFGSS